MKRPTDTSRIAPALRGSDVNRSWQFHSPHLPNLQRKGHSSAERERERGAWRERVCETGSISAEIVRPVVLQHVTQHGCTHSRRLSFCHSQMCVCVCECVWCDKWVEKNKWWVYTVFFRLNTVIYGTVKPWSTWSPLLRFKGVVVAPSYVCLSVAHPACCHF